MKLLVPTDFSEVVNPLLRLTKLIAQAHNANITLLHAVSPVLYVPYPESFGMNVVDLQILTELQKRKIEEAREKLIALQSYLSPIHVDILAEVGDPAELILEKEKDFDLVLMAGHRKSLVERILVGSTTEKVAKYTKIPLLVLKGKEVDSFKKVCVAYDFSKDSFEAFQFALEFLKPFSPEVKILHVEETIELPIVDQIRDSITQHYRKEKRNHLEELVKKAEQVGIKAEFAIIEASSPTDGIQEFVKGEGFDLLIVGSRGLSRLERVLMGSTASELLRRVDLPILIYRKL